MAAIWSLKSPQADPTNRTGEIALTMMEVTTMASLTSRSGAWFDPFEQLRREMDSLFESSFGPASIRSPARGAFPAVNVGVSPESVDVYLFLPGLDPEKLDVAVEDHVLTVTGERPATEGPTAEGPAAESKGRVYLRERFSGGFTRAINLPDEVDPQSSRAEYRNGVLRVSFGRRQEARVRRIEVK
jgi:HSP20 family protein